MNTGDLEKLASDPHQYLAQRFFAVSEGGELSPLYGGTQPSAVMTPAGEVWFPTSRGAVRVLAAESVSSAVPQVFIDQVIADGRALAPSQDLIELPAGNRTLEITYGSILLSPQDAVQVQYKLDGFDRDWRYGSNRRSADYTNLHAARYTFHVRAFEGGSGKLTGRTITIIKQQYFFRTWWFIGLCLAVVVLTVWWIHRQHLKRVEIAFQAVLEERARLAREMHDTLIQGCAGVSLMLEACSVSGGDETDRAELLDYARTQLAASIDEARQAVWHLRGEQEEDFGEMLKNLIARLDRGSNVQVDCKVLGDAYKFHAQATHEIAMVSREAIYNALLHASPTRILVRASFGAEEFALTVEDDGAGFESTANAPSGHYGIIGIQERIQRLGGIVEIRTAALHGTTISIRVPRIRIRSEEHKPDFAVASKENVR